MAKIEVKGNKKVTYKIGDGINFAFVSSPETGRCQLTKFAECREQLCYYLHNFYVGTHTLAPELDTERLRLLITHNNDDKDWKKKFLIAKKIINMYEELAGFDMKSIASSVIHSESDKVVACWQLLGPVEWMRYPQLLSMITLIIRAVVNSTTTTASESINDVEKFLIGLTPKACISPIDYKTHLPTCVPYFSMLMREYKNLFTLDQKTAYLTNNTSENWSIKCGIYSLCKHDSTIKELETKIKQMIQAK